MEIARKRQIKGNYVFLGDYLPRRCGIATFTADLCEAIAKEVTGAVCFAVAMNDRPEGYNYPGRVHFEISESKLNEYQLAADFLNMNQIDLVCVQHEYGIYGGPAGSHLLALLRELRMPVVTTLHTVLKEPTPEQRFVLEEISRLSDRLIVMSGRAVDLLQEIYKVPSEKIAFIHHGIPDVPFVDPNYYKDQFGVEGRKVILTFGLISPGKGIEYMISALPSVIQKHPDVTYIVLGATHPRVKKTTGEEYRLSLQRHARLLGLKDHVIFQNRFVELEELCEFLGVADIYVTPYLAEAQVVSGTLAYSLGSGKAIISTPYWYAQEVLSENRGRIVPFRDSEALAAEVIHLLDNEVERHAMRKRAYTYGREMIWKEVARRYIEVFQAARLDRSRPPGPVHVGKTAELRRTELPDLDLNHLRVLTDDTGILHHARFSVPHPHHGYCTDDNARALIAVTMAQPLCEDDATIRLLSARYLAFLAHAFNKSTGTFRNFMSYDRQWKEEEGSEDCHGRVIWALGVTVAHTEDQGQAGMALNLFERALPGLERLLNPLPMAFGLVGIHTYLRRFGGDTEARRIREILANRLFELFQQNATEDWPWCTDILTYANAKLPHALILSGQWMQRGDIFDMGLRALDWLARIQTAPEGHFSPVGNNGWYVRGGEMAHFDQQPIEALSMLEACVEAFDATRDERWLEEACRAFEWFQGHNDLGIPIYDYTTGGCRDGLHSDRTNLNEGAESTLAWLISLLTMYALCAREELGQAARAVLYGMYDDTDSNGKPS